MPHSFERNDIEDCFAKQFGRILAEQPACGLVYVRERGFDILLEASGDSSMTSRVRVSEFRNPLLPVQLLLFLNCLPPLLHDMS